MPIRKAVLHMDVKNAADAGRIRDRELDEELADVLVAISVITKRLARLAIADPLQFRKHLRIFLRGYAA